MKTRCLRRHRFLLPAYQVDTYAACPAVQAAASQPRAAPGLSSAAPRPSSLPLRMPALTPDRDESLDLMIEIVTRPDLPAKIGPYSQGVRDAGLPFVAGQAGIDPVTERPASKTLAEQARQAFTNVAWEGAPWTLALICR